MFPPVPPRPLCPPGACTCEIAALVQTPHGDRRVLQLTRAEEQRLVQRLENLRDLHDLRHMQQRMAQQLGIGLTLSTGGQEVRSLRGIIVAVREQPGLCRKTRQAIAAAVRKSMAQRPQIAWDWLDEGGLFAPQHQ